MNDLKVLYWAGAFGLADVVLRLRQFLMNRGSFVYDGAAVGIAAFAVFWDGQTHLLFEEGAVGAVISLVLFVAAMAFPFPQAFG